ncbi:MAG: hypothetical protein HY763_15385, partial [Planctomycetes bacterium]|nr:hypothetical protein [Planctomycetota bacterium]
YADYSVLGGVATTTRAYEPGLATVEDPTGPAGSPRSEYYVTDHLGTTRDRSYLGASQARAVYTAFGERVLGPTPPERYGYVGAFSYQQHADFPFLHVGARYYDPASGRFLQRDPIGIEGGANV